MRLACKLKQARILLVCGILSLHLLGCHPNIASISMGEWLQEIQNRANLTAYTTSSVYDTVTPQSPWFEAIQAAYDWNIITENDPIHAEEPLTREWFAYTLSRLEGSTNRVIDENFKDINESYDPYAMSYIIHEGYLNANHDYYAEPKQIMDKEEALQALDIVVERINHRSYQKQPIYDIKLKNPLRRIEFHDLEQLNESTFHTNTTVGIHVGSVFTYRNMDYYIDSSENDQNGILLYVHPLTIDDYVDTLHLANTFEVDFNTVSIADELPVTSYVQNTNAKLMSIYHPLSNSFTFQDFVINYRLTSAGIAVDVLRNLKYGQFYMQFNLNHLVPSYQLDYEDGKVENAYLKVDFNTSEKFGLKHSHYKQLFGDFTTLNAQDLYATIRSFFKEKSEINDVRIPICTLQIPIPNAPALSLLMQLQLKLSADGKAEIALTQTENFGMEIRNGHMRPFSSFENQSETSISASASAVASVLFALQGFHMDLMDVNVDTGAKASIQSSIHLYEEDSYQTNASEIPLDALEELSDGSGDFLVCGDLKGNWVLDAIMNSKQSLLGKHGFSHTFHLLDENTSRLFQKPTLHLENGHIVDHCSRTKRETKKENNNPVLTSDTIQVKQYSIILSKGETKQIELLRLPEGYTQSDLTFISSNPSIASVNHLGNVSANESGSSIVTIQTNDGKHQVKCTILVRTENKS